MMRTPPLIMTLALCASAVSAEPPAGAAQPEPLSVAEIAGEWEITLFGIIEESGAKVTIDYADDETAKLEETDSDGLVAPERLLAYSRRARVAFSSEDGRLTWTQTPVRHDLRYEDRELLLPLAETLGLWEVRDSRLSWSNALGRRTLYFDVRRNGTDELSLDGRREHEHHRVIIRMRRIKP